MQDTAEILRRVRSLESYFRVGLNEATGLRKQLEDIGSPVAPKGITDDEIAKKLVRHEASRLRKFTK